MARSFPRVVRIRARKRLDESRLHKAVTRIGVDRQEQDFGSPQQGNAPIYYS